MLQKRFLQCVSSRIVSRVQTLLTPPTGSHCHVLMTGGVPKDFLGSEILAKRDFFGSMKDAGIFLVYEKTEIFWGFVSFFSSNQQFTACVGFFEGMSKK